MGTELETDELRSDRVQADDTTEARAEAAALAAALDRDPEGQLRGLIAATDGPDRFLAAVAAKSHPIGAPGSWRSLWRPEVGTPSILEQLAARSAAKRDGAALGWRAWTASLMQRLGADGVAFLDRVVSLQRGVVACRTRDSRRLLVNVVLLRGLGSIATTLGLFALTYELTDGKVGGKYVPVFAAGILVGLLHITIGGWHWLKSLARLRAMRRLLSDLSAVRSAGH